MKRLALLILFILAATKAPGKDAPQTSPVADYNISWTTQSQESADSMPLAGGILGLNIWVENNDLYCLIGSPNCLNENGMQVKLGRLRLRFSPVVFASNFRQELRLEQSEIVISGQTPSGAPVSVRVWCDVDRPVIHAQTAAGEPVDVEIAYETWSGHTAKYVEGGLQWMYRLNPAKDRRKKDMANQGMAEFASAIPDPLRDLTLGGRIYGENLIPAGTAEGTYRKLKLKTSAVKTAKPVNKLDLCIALRMEQDKSIEDWETKLADSTREAAQAGNIAKARAQSLEWWKEFWNRSFIQINPGKTESDEPWVIGRNYQLFRYQLAANRNGRMMTLFNGGVFACENNPDSRMWDRCQNMAQNQRMVYWPLLRSGDFDLLKVALDFYCDRTEANRLHAKKFWGVDGVAYSEGFSVFGLDSIGVNEDGRCRAKHLNYHYTSGMEFALMMLEYDRYTGQTNTPYLAPAEGIISYYDQFYQKAWEKKRGKPLDENGHLVIYPSDACEPFHGCTNNSDVIAGLLALTEELLALPPDRLSPAKRAYYEGFLKRIPPIPIWEVKGHRVVAPALSWEWVFTNGNMDFPNMYVCFPFNRFFLGRKDDGIAIASNTWDYGAIRPGVQRQGKCWYQSAINLARMGRTQDARDYTTKKFIHPSARFPAFWRNPRFCQMPDTDHGGSAMLGLQEMLMQCDGRRILLAPAWPAEWDCHFKLVAPYQTTVECRIEKGQVTVLKVTPESRRKDIEIFPPKPTRPLQPENDTLKTTLPHTPRNEPVASMELPSIPVPGCLAVSSRNSRPTPSFPTVGN